jgi:hypothetical protein
MVKTPAWVSTKPGKLPEAPGYISHCGIHPALHESPTLPVTQNYPLRVVDAESTRYRVEGLVFRLTRSNPLFPLLTSCLFVISSLFLPLPHFQVPKWGRRCGWQHSAIPFNI